MARSLCRRQPTGERHEGICGRGGGRTIDGGGESAPGCGVGCPVRPNDFHNRQIAQVRPSQIHLATNIRLGQKLQRTVSGVVPLDLVRDHCRAWTRRSHLDDRGWSSMAPRYILTGVAAPSVLNNAPWPWTLG